MTIETMTDKQFNAFFEWLPARVQLLVKGGFVDYKEVLPEWLEMYKVELKG